MFVLKVVKLYIRLAPLAWSRTSQPQDAAQLRFPSVWFDVDGKRSADSDGYDGELDIQNRPL